MGFEQIDGNKNVLVREDGKVREGLRNIEPEYERDEKGNIRKDKWPVVLVAGDTGGLDKRLLPVEVLRLHGDLPRHIQVLPEELEAKDGDKTNCERGNIIYKPSKGESPYKEDPKKAKATDPEKSKKPPQNDKDEEISETEGTSSTGTQVNPEAEMNPADQQDVKENSSGNKIGVKSSDLNAGDAIEIIENNTYDDLIKSGFYTEGKDGGRVRITVQQAWEKKQKEESGE